MDIITCNICPTLFTGSPLRGANGLTPFIGSNGNWWIGTQDLGVKATGDSPYIGANGHWFVGTTDTGVKAQGDPGAAATIVVGTTTTLPAGSAATVTNSGTSSAAIFNFGIPLGLPGAAGASLDYAGFLGARLNETDAPQVVTSGSPILWKTLTYNEGGTISPSANNILFKFVKLGRYFCSFSVRVSATSAGVFSWGIRNKTKNVMVTTASSWVTPNMVDVAGSGIIDITSTTDEYEFVNNSKFSVDVEGAKSTLVVYGFIGALGVNTVDGLSCQLIRLGNVPLSEETDAEVLVEEIPADNIQYTQTEFTAELPKARKAKTKV